MIEDYLLTNRTLDLRSLSKGPASPANSLAAMSPEAAKALGAVDRSYIEAAFAVIDTHAGGAEGYLSDEFGLSRQAIARLRGLYLA